MRILVTGGTGFLGRRLCARLRREGMDVTALVRPSSDGRGLAALGIQQLPGDVRDAESLKRATRGQDAVIHAAALVPLDAVSAGAYDEINVGGTRNVVTACRGSRVARLVHVSSVAAIGIPDDPRPADETFAFNLEGSGLAYHLSKREAEQVVAGGVTDGLDAVVVNPSSIHGPHGSQFRGAELPEGVRRRRLVPCFWGGTNVVHVDDAVDGILAGLRRGRTGERYILGGENLTWRQMALIAAGLLGVNRIVVRLPPLLTAAIARADRARSRKTGGPPRFTREVLYCTRRFMYYDSHKAIADLGFKPSRYADVLRQYLERERLRDTEECA